MTLFFDPVFRAPIWGTLFMCIASSLIGVVLFLKKRTLLAESLSHATYPGVVVGISCLGLWLPQWESYGFIVALLGAFVSSFLAFCLIRFLQEKQKVSADAALCFVLSLFFGLGVLATSVMQFVIPAWTGQVQMLLFGQAATMTDIHIVFYGILALIVVGFFVISFYPLQSFLFDEMFSQSIGIRVRTLEKLFGFLFLLSLILGIRSVGVVLMTGMVIAPAVAARQFTNQLHKMFLLSGFFGALSGILGNFLSIYFAERGKSLPTGPMIVLVGCLIAFFSLSFAPKRGWVFRRLRIGTFHFRCLEENLLKALWKQQSLPKSLFLPILLYKLRRQGWVCKQTGAYSLTQDGNRKASHIVRLHRLWELYLTNVLNMHVEKVHRTAEEMEHILTPDIEERLTKLLANPQVDPHRQPIPQKVEVL